MAMSLGFPWPSSGLINSYYNTLGPLYTPFKNSFIFNPMYMSPLKWWILPLTSGRIHHFVLLLKLVMMLSIRHFVVILVCVCSLITAYLLENRAYVVFCSAFSGNQHCVFHSQDTHMYEGICVYIWIYVCMWTCVCAIHMVLKLRNFLINYEVQLCVYFLVCYFPNFSFSCYLSHEMQNIRKIFLCSNDLEHFQCLLIRSLVSTNKNNNN